MKLSLSDGCPERTVEGLFETNGAPLGDGEDGKRFKIVGGVPVGASPVAAGSANGCVLSNDLSKSLVRTFRWSR